MIASGTPVVVHFHRERGQPALTGTVRGCGRNRRGETLYEIVASCGCCRVVAHAEDVAPLPPGVDPVSICNRGGVRMNDPTKLRRRIFAACKQRGIDDDSRRAIQREATGEVSLTAMSPAQMRKALAAIEARGSGDSLPDHRMTPLLRALWISGWHLGVVRDRTDRALCRFVAQSLGVDAARFAGPRLGAAVEEVKRLLAREGGVDWSRSDLDLVERPTLRPRVAVIEAQWRILLELGAAKTPGAIDHYVSRLLKIGVRSIIHLEDAQADEAIRLLGARIRRARARASAG